MGSPSSIPVLPQAFYCTRVDGTNKSYICEELGFEIGMGAADTLDEPSASSTNGMNFLEFSLSFDF